MSADAADAAHLAQDGQRVRHDANHIGRIHDIERLVESGGAKYGRLAPVKDWSLLLGENLRKLQAAAN